MKFIIIQLLNIINTSSENETDHILAEYMLHHLKEMQDMTIYQISDQCYVSTATISRFVRHLGYKNFNQLRDNLEWSNQFKEIFYYMPEMNNLIDYKEKVKDSLDHSADLLDERQLSRILSFIHSANIISINAVSVTHAIAFQLQLFLMELNKQVYSYTHIKQQIDLIRSLKQGDLIIILSVRGNFLQEIISELKEAKARHVKIVLLTLTKDIKFAEYIDEILVCGDHEDYEYGYYIFLMYIHYLSSCYQKKYPD